MTTDHPRFRSGTEYRDNAAWRLASHWQQRAQKARPAGHLRGVKLALAWVLGCAVLLVATLLGVLFSLVGLLMLPLVRHRMKKRMEQARADHAEDIGPGWQKSQQQNPHQAHATDILEGQYEVKS